jgi:thymidine kinase
MNGLITVISGPMFAGKTKKLIEYYHNLKEADKRILVFKPTIDKRYSQTEIVSHDNEKIPALAVKEVKEISQFLDQDTEIILIDEVQLFFSDEMVGFFDNLAKEGKQIIATSLD